MEIKSSMLNAMADAFLTWPLPRTVCPDACTLNKDYAHRVGTNLLTHTEARQMFEYVLAKVQEADATRRDDLIKKLNDGFTPEANEALSKLASITNPARDPQPVCDVCGDNEEQHKAGTGYDHAFIGAVFELPPEGQEPPVQPDFRKEIEHVINCHSKENGSNTPDFILAQYLVDCLAAYDKAVTAREKWYGREPKPVPADLAPQPVGKPFLTSI